MFYTEYDPLTEKYVTDAVAARGRADGGSEGVLAGQTVDLDLAGEYAPDSFVCRFGTDGCVRFTLDGKTETVPYAGRERNGIAIISFTQPAKPIAWHMVLDTRTGAAVVAETWFGITVPVGYDLRGGKPPVGTRDIPRELQRQLHFGAYRIGGEAPTCTNRLEGAGYHWKYDTGKEILTFFPSVSACTVVELGSAMGGITVTNPADYVRLDDRYYVVFRWDAVFSGAMELDVIDLFDMESLGLTFGFDEKNGLGYYFRGAQLTMTGTLAHLEMIGDNGDKPYASPFLKGKGARYVYRPKDMHLPMTHAEALEKIARELHVFDNVDGVMDSGHNMPLSDKLAGRRFAVRPDREKYAQAPWTGKPGPGAEYEFLSRDELRVRLDGGEWHTEKVRCFEADGDLFFFAHMLTGDPDYAMLAQAVDFRTGLTTTIRCAVGNWHSEWESGAEVLFGTLVYPGVTPPFARRHHFTDELVGCSFAWNYQDDMNSIHMYSSPESYSWTIFRPDNAGGATWSSPCFYIKLREDVYLFSWSEENCNGNQGIVVINRRIRHDGGFFYGMYQDGLKLSITGAYMRELGKLDIRKYFL